MYNNKVNNIQIEDSVFKVLGSREFKYDLNTMIDERISKHEIFKKYSKILSGGYDYNSLISNRVNFYVPKKINELLPYQVKKEINSQLPVIAKSFISNEINKQLTSGYAVQNAINDFKVIANDQKQRIENELTKKISSVKYDITNLEVKVSKHQKDIDKLLLNNINNVSKQLVVASEKVIKENENRIKIQANKVLNDITNENKYHQITDSYLANVKQRAFNAIEKIENKQNNEINELTKTVNTLIKNNNELIGRVYKSEQKVKELENIFGAGIVIVVGSLGLLAFIGIIDSITD